MDSASTSSGFSNHVMNQLQDISHQQSHRGHGHGHGRGRGPGRNRGSPRGGPLRQPHTIEPPTQMPWANTSEDFPPLGALPPVAPSPALNNPQTQYQAHSSVQSQPAFTRYRESPRDFQERARGSYRGHRQPHSTSQYYQPGNPGGPHGANNYGRRPPRNGQLFNPNNDLHHSTHQQQQNMKHVISKQSQYLLDVGKKAHATHKLQKEESMALEAFRQELEKVAKDALAANYTDLDIRYVRLKCYGSLANGFALAGCDMDLLLSLPDYEITEITSATPPASDNTGEDPEAELDAEERGFKVHVRRILEKALLDRSYGARLLTNTRVPILRVCQAPGAELLNNLRQNRTEWERSLHVKTLETGKEAPPATPRLGDTVAEVGNGGVAEVESVGNALDELRIADGTPAPATSRGNTKLEFTGNVGIHCDINFTNSVAFHNSQLLRLYHDFDPRVADLGLFVKIWAKARDINTPYRGTLSSYGYILMVLHYLMHVARPPVIPNLQALAKIEDGWNPGQPIELFEGFDIRFVRDAKEIEEARSMMPKNNESTGQLIRGFFQYYATREGFHWTHNVISIREKQARLSKIDKGWTEAKWSQKSKQQVRLRYLLAIEDPFEVEHNIARTVGHHGLVAIRDEFRRAWAIIERVGADAEVTTDEFLEQVINRGDTLRKDQEFHRQKQLLMKQEAEAKEKELVLKANEENPDGIIDGTSGSANHGHSQTAPSLTSVGQGSHSKLTGTKLQERENQSHRQGKRSRRVKDESDTEDDDSVATQTTRTRSSRADSDSRLSETNGRAGVFCPVGIDTGSDGFDANGNLKSWDIDTQDGRWLLWRDKKIRHGSVLHFSNPLLQELHEKCPYHPERPYPNATNRTYRQRIDEANKYRPPWPATSTTSLNKTSGDQLFYPHAVKVVPSNQGKGLTSHTGFLPAASDSSGANTQATSETGSKQQLPNTINSSGDPVLRATNLEPSAPLPVSLGTKSGPVERQSAMPGVFRVASPHMDATGVESGPDTSSFKTTSPVTRHTCSTADEPSLRLPDFEFVRAQRLAFFDQTCSQSVSEFVSNINSSCHDSKVNSFDGTPSGCAGAASVGLGVCSTSPMVSSDLSHPAMNTTTTADKGGRVSQESSPRDDSMYTASGSVGASTDSPAQSPLIVPATLYCEVDGDKRPREEDPRIMPIPCELGFQFDTRQLLDLNVIAKGGNGCARDGAEYSIEEDYELGGGGMMGNRMSTGVEQSEEVDVHKPYEPGNGDVEGLLNELPEYGVDS